MNTHTLSTADLECLVAAALHDIGCDVDQITPADHLLNDLGMDSTELVELGIVLREKCGIAVRVDLRELDTTGAVIAKLQELLSQ